MTRATQKEQATTILKSNLLNVNHFEYEQDLQERFVTNFLNSCRLLKFEKRFPSILEIFAGAHSFILYACVQKEIGQIVVNRRR